MFPPHTLVTQYKVEVESASTEDFPFCTLPVMPISLPRNMGVWAVKSHGAKLSDEFIPMQTGQFQAVSDVEQLRFLENQVGYYAEGNKIFFTRDISTSPYNITELRISLLIIDPTVLGEYDYLAIPAEHEEAIITECLTILGALPKVCLLYTSPSPRDS